jgi:hypothetical protein
MDTGKRVDPSELWSIRIERIRRYRERSDPNGMTRPPRDPDERRFLRETGWEGPYEEAEQSPAQESVGGQANRNPSDR